MIFLAPILLSLLPQDAVEPRYGADRAPRDPVFSELKLGIRIEGADALANLVRSMHPLLSMEKLLLRAEGGAQVVGNRRRKVDYEEARIEVRYDDEDHEYEFQKGQPPEGDKDKLRQLMWFIAAGGRNYSLSPEGDYRSDDPNQDHNGEAMDLIALGITRMPEHSVKPGESYEKTWKGQRSEKGKKARFDFRQVVTVEKIEEMNGRRVATLLGDLTGKLDGPKDPAADEGWTRVEGKTRTQIEIETGRVLASEGKGIVTSYFRNTADNGARQELRLTFSVEGKLAVKQP